MSETAIIYYHKPKIRRTNLRREILMNADYTLSRMSEEAKTPSFDDRLADFPVQPAIKEMPPVAHASLPQECSISLDNLFNCSANTLRSLGLTGKYDGFIYICRAIEEILKEKEPPHFQSIYYDIGKEYDVNRCSVERSIRYAIGYIRRNGNTSKLGAIFGDAACDEKNFSNSKFLTILAADVYEKLTSLEVNV